MAACNRGHSGNAPNGTVVLTQDHTLPAVAGGRVTKNVAYPRPSAVRGSSGDGAD